MVISIGEEFVGTKHPYRIPRNVTAMFYEFADKSVVYKTGLRTIFQSCSSV